MTTVICPPAVLSTGPEAITAAREYAESIAGWVIERDRAGSVPWGELVALDASGLLGITVPAAFGGPDLSPVVLAEVTADGADIHANRAETALMMAINGLSTKPVINWASPELKAKYAADRERGEPGELLPVGGRRR